MIIQESLHWGFSMKFLGNVSQGYKVKIYPIKCYFRLAFCFEDQSHIVKAPINYSDTRNQQSVSFNYCIKKQKNVWSKKVYVFNVVCLLFVVLKDRIFKRELVSFLFLNCCSICTFPIPFTLATRQNNKLNCCGLSQSVSRLEASKAPRWRI